MIPVRDEPKARVPSITNLILIFVTGVVFFNQLTLTETGPADEIRRYFERWGLVPGRDRESFSFVYLSHLFLHGNFWHFAFNMWTLNLFGTAVEARIGRVSYVLFYLLCGLAGSLGYVWLHPDSAVPLIGASGAVSGVMGAYLMLFPGHRIVTFVPVFFLPLFMRVPARLFLGLWLALQVGNAWWSASSSETGIAYEAHLAGFAAGIGLQYLFVFRTKKSP